MEKTAYNSFVVVECKTRTNVLCTQSARKALAALEKGRKIEVWNNGSLVESVYSTDGELFQPYVEAEKAYIAEKQKRATERNERRRSYGEEAQSGNCKPKIIG